MDKVKQYRNNPIAKTAIQINVITPARDSYSAMSRNTPAGRPGSAPDYALTSREKSAILYFVTLFRQKIVFLWIFGLKT
jgi:hypothetical protein